MFPVTIICEGSSENAYLQSLNRILRCTNYSWDVGPFIPRVAHQGYYGSVIAKLKEEQQRNRKSTFHVWVDRDIYIRNTKNSQTNYQQKPKNIPKGEAGMLLVTGDEESTIKQIWFCEEENSEIFTRNLSSAEWSNWESIHGKFEKDQGYIIFPNSLMIEWGTINNSLVTYPVAFTKTSIPLFNKIGWNSSYERSDTGIISYSLTGLHIGSGGYITGITWLAIGY